MSDKILLVEDEPGIAGNIVHALSTERLRPFALAGRWLPGSVPDQTHPRGTPASDSS